MDRVCKLHWLDSSASICREAQAIGIFWLFPWVDQSPKEESSKFLPESYEPLCQVFLELFGLRGEKAAFDTQNYLCLGERSADRCACYPWGQRPSASQSPSIFCQAVRRSCLVQGMGRGPRSLTLIWSFDSVHILIQFLDLSEVLGKILPAPGHSSLLN